MRLLYQGGWRTLCGAFFLGCTASVWYLGAAGLQQPPGISNNNYNNAANNNADKNNNIKNFLLIIIIYIIIYIIIIIYITNINTYLF